MAYYFEFLSGLWRRKQSISVSTGAADADKIVSTNSNGVIDNSLLPVRKVGLVYAYTGTDGNGAGYFDDFDGKWVYLTLDSYRTIGSPSSGASVAAAWTQTLFTHLWGSYDNSAAPLLDSSGGAASRGVSASADFSANRRLTFPDLRGRVIGAAGGGSGLTTRTKGAMIGAEVHQLTVNETPIHAHNALFMGGTAVNPTTVFAPATARGTTAPGPATDTAGGGQSHNNMQPTQFEHLVISAGAR